MHNILLRYITLRSLCKIKIGKENLQMRMKKVIALGLVLGMSVFSVACGSKSADKPSVREESAVQQNGGIAEQEPQESEERVVAASVAVVQILDALGVPMVGVPTSSYDLPESVAKVTRIGSAMTPDIEVIADLEPSVVVSVDSLSEDLKSQFDSMNVESQFVNLNSYQGLQEAISTLGKRFEKEDKAEELLASFAERIKDLEDAAKGQEAPSVLIIFGAGDSFMAASESSYVGNLAALVGAKNVLEDAKGSFVPVDMEYLAEKNPDYILFMSHANPEESLAAFEKEFESNEAWKNFDAVKNGKVVALESTYFGMSANLLAVDAMEQLAGILYGE